MKDKGARFFLLAAANALILYGLTLLVDLWWDGISQYLAFFYTIAAGMAAKAAGDLLYYTVSPSRRTWMYLEDYILGDFLVHSRFVFPLACVQAWSANTILVFYPTLRRLCLSPLVGVLVWAINRWAVEAAEDKRNRPLGGGAATLIR